MNKHGLTPENLMTSLPQVLKNDSNLNALATSIAGILSKRRAEIAELLIYSRIDELPEELLDILAYDFKVDWWDYDFTLEQKRQTLKDSWHVHRHLGTKYSVETAISAVFPNSEAQEWFEYGGDPYTFQLLIDVSNMIINPEFHFRVLALTDYYKNLRSHLTRIIYTLRANEDAVIRLGGQFASIVSICIPEIADDFFFEESVRVGGHMTSITSLPIPGIPDELIFEAPMRVGGRMANITTITLPNPQDA